MKSRVKKFDLVATKFIVRLFGERTRALFLGLTVLGDPITVTVVSVGMAVVGLSLDEDMLVMFAVMVPVVLIIGSLVKVMVERARPLTEYAMRMRIHTYSFPSGHSTGSTAAYGSIALYLAFMSHEAVNIGVLALLLLPFGVGLSRIYLGAHFPSDVIAGWALGLLGIGLAFVLAGL